MKKRHLNVLILLICIALLTGCTPSQDPSSERGLGEAPRIGYRAPNFRLENLEGEEVSLAGYRGQVVFINFWATWCVPCKAEMPSMQALYKDYKDKGLEILAVSSDFEGETAVRPFVEEMRLTYPILLDSDFRVDSRYLIRSVPTTILVGRDGVITHKLIGARNWNTPEARDLIEKLLEVKS
jgi:peroxiredoxin